VRDSLNFPGLSLALRDDRRRDPLIYEMTPVWSAEGYTRYETALPFSEPGLFWYWFLESEGGANRTIGRDGFNRAVLAEGGLRAWQVTVYSPDYETPAWLSGGAIYHIFVDRFCKLGDRPLHPGSIFRSDWGGVPVFEPDSRGVIVNNDFFGGNLDGVIEKLPYLEELGISCIYLSPVFEARSNHKYDTGDYLKIDPSFGDNETFSRLCAEAKALGIAVICDGVFNHTGDDSVYFDRYGSYGGHGAYGSRDSRYYPWYSFSNWPNDYEAWWGIKTLPQVREHNPDYRSFMFGEDGVLRRWLRAGASGWRLDVADELPEEFLRELRRAVKTEKPDALIIGEVWEDASTKIAYGERRYYFVGDELDGVMNYPFRTAIIDFVLSGNADAFREAVENLCENYPKPALDCAMNILGTHDTPRILTILGGVHYETKRERARAALDAETRRTAASRLKIASLLQCTLPGTPCVYYGDEAGLEGYEDPLNRRCYPWGNEDTELLSWYRELLHVRRGSEAFRGGIYQTLRSENGLFVFQRKSVNARVIAAVNLGQETAITCDGTARLLISSGATVSGDRIVMSHGSAAIIEVNSN
jgi:glycosidase